MVSITCPCSECTHNGRGSKCTAKKINLTYRNMATVNEGRVDMWICDMYELSKRAEIIRKFLRDILNGGENDDKGE